MLMRFHIVIVEYKSGTYANVDGCYGYLTIMWRIPSFALFVLRREHTQIKLATAIRNMNK